MLAGWLSESVRLKGSVGLRVVIALLLILRPNVGRVTLQKPVLDHLVSDSLIKGRGMKVCGLFRLQEFGEDRWGRHQTTRRENLGE